MILPLKLLYTAVAIVFLPGSTPITKASTMFSVLGINSSGDFHFLEETIVTVSSRTSFGALNLIDTATASVVIDSNSNLRFLLS